MKKLSWISALCAAAAPVCAQVNDATRQQLEFARMDKERAMATAEQTEPPWPAPAPNFNISNPSVTLVRTWKDEKMEIFTDLDSVSPYKKILQAWSQASSYQPFTTKNSSLTYSHERVLHYFNCSNWTLSQKQIIMYERENGKQVANFTTDEDKLKSLPSHPGSIGYQLLSAVCKKALQPMPPPAQLASPKTTTPAAESSSGLSDTAGLLMLIMGTAMQGANEARQRSRDADDSMLMAPPAPREKLKIDCSAKDSFGNISCKER